VFTNYAISFQKRFVPELEETNVESIDQQGSEFLLELDNNARVKTRHIILATGITWFDRMPDVFANLPPSLISHSFGHSDAKQFAGKDVIVVGAGASATDSALLLDECKARVRIIARDTRLRFHGAPSPKGRSLYQRLRHPQTVIGPGWRSNLYTSSPLLFHRLPDAVRSAIVRTHLGPGPGWFVKKKIEQCIPMILGCEIERAIARNDGVEMMLLSADGTISTVQADHVVAATGYKVDIRRIPVLTPRLRRAIVHYRYNPLLSTNFESSVPGLYFVGPAAANAFGPLMRFMVGAEWVAPRISRHLRRILHD
jgi:hypothetical protein